MSEIDMKKLGFGYIKAPKRYVARFKDGKWGKGYLSDDENIVINESACVLQYAQTCFEGMKAYRTEDGSIVCFRPDLNADRMIDSCKRMVMPPFPKEEFLRAVKEVVLANADLVPPYGSGGSLYIRPFMFGYSPVLGVKPSVEYEFRMFCSPVGPYFKEGVKPIKLRTSDFDRAAPHGTGHIKAGLNYAMSIYAYEKAHEAGFAENVYLDSATRSYIEETGGANIIFITQDNKLVTPKSDTILPSITRRSLLYVAEHYLGMETEERRIKLTECKDFKECGLCGTAAVISPVSMIFHKDEVYHFGSETEMGETIKKLYDTLTGIQFGRIEAPEGWIFKIK